MIQSIVSGIILMIISGIAFVAYNHPNYYREKLNWMLFLLFTIYISLTVHNSVIKYTFYKLEKYIPKEKRNIAYNDIIKNQILEDYLIYGYLGIGFFLLFLGLLKILKDKN